MKRYRLNLNKLGNKRADQSLPPINCTKAPVYNAIGRRTPDRNETSKEQLLVIEKMIIPNKSEMERQRKRSIELNKTFKNLSLVLLLVTIKDEC